MLDQSKRSGTKGASTASAYKYHSGYTFFASLFAFALVEAPAGFSAAKATSTGPLQFIAAELALATDLFNASHYSQIIRESHALLTGQGPAK